MANGEAPAPTGEDVAHRVGKSVRMHAKSLLHAAAFAFAALAATTSHAQDCDGPASSAKLVVQVDGVRSSNGLVAVTLYPDDPDRFLRRHGSLKVVRVAA